jgi:hypothetical protein
MKVTVNGIGGHVCEHGTAVDVHCCNCHNGFVFDMDHECPPPAALVPALYFKCVDACHVFVSPDKKGRCACGKWLIAVAARE